MRLRRPITCSPQIGRDRFDAFGLSSSVKGSPLAFSGDFSQTMRPQMLCPHLARRTAPRPVSSYQMPVTSSAEAGGATNSKPSAAVPAAKVFKARRTDVLRAGVPSAEAVGEEPSQRLRNILLISRQVSRSHKRRWGSYDEQLISPQAPLVDLFRNSLVRSWLPLAYRLRSFKASPWQDLSQVMAAASQSRHQTQTKAASGLPCTCILYDAQDRRLASIETRLDVGANVRQDNDAAVVCQRASRRSGGALTPHRRVWPSGLRQLGSYVFASRTPTLKYEEPGSPGSSVFRFER